MKNKKVILLASSIVVVAVAWFLFRPERLFVNRAVDEAFPVEGAAESSGSAMSVALLMGQFHGVAHDTRGTASIYELADGKRVLRLTGFETSNGPDVQVYLGKASDATDNETVTRAGFFHVGALKGNVGDQNYDLPADLNVSDYRSVTIWCRRFGVNFGTAPLKMSTSMPSAVKLSEGEFHGVAHETMGKAALFQLPGGQRVLRLTGFETSNGPDVQVYLGKAADAFDNDTVTNAGFFHVGALKGNIGDQNYELPSDLNLSDYRSVTIWCRRFGVNFGTAPLATSGNA